MRLRPLTTVALALACCSCSLEQSVADRFLQPRQEFMASPADVGLRYENVELKTGPDTTVHGWFVPADGGDGRAVLLCHGNGANVSFYHPYYRFLHDAGYHVLLFDYRGFGRSRGALDVEALFDDTARMLEYLRRRPDVDAERVALLGISLGAIVALRIAADHPEVAGVVVEDVSSPHQLMASSLGGFATFFVELLALPGHLEPADNAARIHRPAVYLTGAWDPGLREHLEAFARAGGPAACWVMPETGHAPNGMLMHDGDYQRAILRGLDGCISGTLPRVEITAQEATGKQLSIDLRRRDLGEGPLPIELCLASDDGQVAFARQWMRGERDHWQLELPFDGRAVCAWPYDADRVAATPDGVHWHQPPGRMARAENARLTLVAMAEITAEAAHPTPPALAFVQELARLEHDLGGLPDQLEAELVPSYLQVGRALAANPEHAAEARTILHRCVEAAPANPALHYWPSSPYVAGFHHGDAVEAARQLLAQLPAGTPR